MTHTTIAPLRQQDRLSIIDTLRGVALLGILMMNIPSFSTPQAYVFNLNLRNEFTGPNYYTWWVVNGFFEGTMRAIYSMLFGAGCLLLLNRLEKKQLDTTPADIYYRRLLWLLLFGLVNAFIFQWPGDILFFYAICGLFLFPFRKMAAKHLFMIGIAFLLLSTMKGTYMFYKSHQTRVQGEAALVVEKQKGKLTDQQKEAKEKWVAYLDKRKPDNVKKEATKEIKKVSEGNYFETFGFYSGITAMIESKKFYHFAFFDIMTLLFIGMSFFKWNVLTGKKPTRFYWGLLAIGYGLGIPLSYWEHMSFIHIKFDFSRAFETFYVDVYQFRRVLLALGHISVFMLIYKYNVLRWLHQGLAKVGQMAFTNYLMQSIICTTVFYGFGFGLFGKLQRYETYYVVFAVWAFQILFSHVWLHYFQFGPFEWAWRSLTYWKKQPLKHHQNPKTPEGEAPIPEGKVIVVSPSTAL